MKWFRFGPESQSYSPKIGVTDQESELQPGRPPESEPNHPEKQPESGLDASTGNPPEAFLKPPIGLQHPRPATGVSQALRARSVSGVSRECPSGCLWGPSGPGLRSVQKVSRECPRSVKKVSRTLREHSRDTFWTLRSPEPEGPQRHPEGHSRDTPETLRARRAWETPVAGRGGCNYRDRKRKSPWQPERWQDSTLVSPPGNPGNELTVIWKGWFETAPCRATLATPFPALCPKHLGTRFTNYGLRMFNRERINGDLKRVIWDCSLQSDSEHPIFSPLSKNSRNTVYKLRFASLRKSGNFLHILKTA